MADPGQAPVAASDDQKAKPFSLRRQTFALTYSRAINLTSKQDLLDFLLDLHPTTVGAIVVKEDHKDGTPHFHTFQQLPRRYHVRNARHFDFQGYHPKIRPAWDPAGWIKYLTELKKCDPDPLIFGDIEEMKKKKKTRQEGYDEAVLLAKEGKLEEAQDIIKSVDHPNYARSYKTISEYLASYLPLVPEAPEYNIDDFHVPPQIYDQWEPNRQALVLYGTPGTGKTNMAKALFQANYVTVGCREDLRLCDKPGITKFILDDFNFDQFNREDMVHLLDVEQDRRIRVLYGRAKLPAGHWRILVTNDLDRIRHFMLPEVQRRCFLVQITSDLRKREGLPRSP